MTGELFAGELVSGELFAVEFFSCELFSCELFAVESESAWEKLVTLPHVSVCLSGLLRSFMKCFVIIALTCLFSRSGVITGSNTTDYLLEKSRIVMQVRYTTGETSRYTSNGATRLYIFLHGDNGKIMMFFFAFKNKLLTFVTAQVAWGILKKISTAWMQFWKQSLAYPLVTLINE